ncbi:MAG: hypothetical protein GF390_02505 [Candidatus Pacebacteria bacterium]|nr:hypothetical protein [Candidatus Paceibacterota bacterium]
MPSAGGYIGASATVMTILDDGNVGIGTTSPDDNLHIYDSSALLRLEGDRSGNSNDIAQINIENSGEASNYIAARIESYNDNSSYDGDLRFHTNSNGSAGATTNLSERMRIDSGGNIYMYNIPVYTGTIADLMINTSTGQLYYSGTSSLRYKENIHDQVETDWLDDVRVVTYDRKDGSRINEVGIIAEELYQIAPELVFYNKQGQIEGYNKSDFVPYLIKALQKTNQQLAQLDLTLTSTGNLVINQTAPQEYQVTAVDSDSPITKLAALAELVVGKIRVGLIQAQQISTQSLAAVTANLQTVTTKALLATQANIAQLTSKNITITNDQGQAVAQLDQAGNAEFAGDLKINKNLMTDGELIAKGDLATEGRLSADNLKINSDATIQGQTKLGQLLVNQDATVSGTLKTQNLEVTTSTRLAYLEGKVAQLEEIRANTAELVNATVSGTLYANNIDGFEDKVASAFRQPSLLGVLMSTETSDTEPAPPEEVIETVETAGYTATSSAQIQQKLAELNLAADDVVITPAAAFINKYFEVNGDSYIAQNLGVGQQLIIGDGLIIGQNFIDYQPSTQPTAFSLLPSGQGSLSLLANLMILDDTGQVTVNGDFKVTGTLAAEQTQTKTLLSNLIRPLNYDQPTRVQVAGIATESGEVKKSRFEIVNELGSPVATISAEGRADFAAGVTAQKLHLSDKEISDQAGTEISTDKSSGKAKLKAGETQLTIKSNQIQTDSLIYITPVGSTKNQVLYIKSQRPDNPDTPQQEGNFIVALDQAINTDLSFNWWVVN